MVGEEDLVAWKFFSLEFTFVIVDGQEERRRPCGGNGHVNKCSGRDRGGSQRKTLQTLSVDIESHGCLAAGLRARIGVQTPSCEYRPVRLTALCESQFVQNRITSLPWYHAPKFDRDLQLRPDARILHRF